MADEREVQVNCYSFASVGGPPGINKHTCRNERTAVTKSLLRRISVMRIISVIMSRLDKPHKDLANSYTVRAPS